MHQMTIDPETLRFADSARSFCEWAEGSPGSPKEEALAARRYLASLYGLALNLPESAFGEEDPAGLSDDKWQTVFSRFSALPFTYYSSFFDPSTAVTEEASLGDLADDLADIWRDLKDGLTLFDAGHTGAATFTWRFGFNSHWGRHASSALYALHCWSQANSA